MRVLFPDARDAAELERIDAAADACWALLEREAAAPSEHLRALLSPRLAELDERIELRIHGRAPERLLTLSPGAERRRMPLVRRVVSRAPRLDGWRFAAVRPPFEPDEAFRSVQADSGLDLSRARARAAFTRGRRIDVTVDVPGVARERALDAAESAVEALLGEELLHGWIGAVEVAPLPRGGPLHVLREREPGTFPLARLGEVVGAATRAAVEQLPVASSVELRERAAWTLLEAEPQPGSAEPDRGDVVLISTMLPEMTRAWLDGGAFSSARFARSERFCAVAVDAAGEPAERVVARRTALEACLDAGLARGGCVVAAGLGLRWAWLLLALGELERDVPRVQGLLAAAGARGRILPCDDELGDEWVETPDR